MVKYTHIRVSTELKEKLRERAHSAGLSITEFLERLLESECKCESDRADMLTYQTSHMLTYQSPDMLTYEPPISGECKAVKTDRVYMVECRGKDGATRKAILVESSLKWLAERGFIVVIEERSSDTTLHQTTQQPPDESKSLKPQKPDEKSRAPPLKGRKSGQLPLL